RLRRRLERGGDVHQLPPQEGGPRRRAADPDGPRLRLLAAAAVRLRPASLRARLLLITLAMVAVGLALAGWAVNRSLHSFLVDRVDRDLLESTGPALGQLTEPDFFGGGARVPRGLPNDAAAQLRDAAGRKVKGTEVRDS